MSLRCSCKCHHLLTKHAHHVFNCFIVFKTNYTNNKLKIINMTYAHFVQFKLPSVHHTQLHLHSWLIWHKCQRAYATMNCPLCVVVVVIVVQSSSSVDAPPGHKFDDRNFKCCTHMHIRPLVHEILGQYDLLEAATHPNAYPKIALT